MKRLFSGLALAAVGSLLFSASGETRTWTDVSGREVEGELIKVMGESILLRVGGKDFTLPVSKFGEEDQAFIKEWESSTGGGSTEGAASKEWPDSIEIPGDLEIVKFREDKDADEYIYRSPHFEFQSDIQLSTSLIREFCRIFEATYETLRQLPVGMDPKAPDDGYYLTQLFRTKDDYYAGGGMAGSGGMYSGREKKIMIPLENLGVRDVGNRFVVEPKDDNQVLKHEIAHQVMHYWLGRLPVWFTEGWAEYIAAAPYSKGRYKFTGIDRAVRDDVLDGYLAEGKEFQMVGIERLMTITGKEWSEDLSSTGNTAGRNYKSAMLLLYFFLHMDKDENGENMAAFFAAIKNGLGYEAALESFFMRGRSYDDIAEAVKKGWRSEGMQIAFADE